MNKHLKAFIDHFVIALIAFIIAYLVKILPTSQLFPGSWTIVIVGILGLLKNAFLNP